MLRAARRIDPQRSGAHSALLYRALSLQAGEMFGELSVLRIEVVSGCTLTCTTPQCKRPQLVAISSFGCSAIVAIDTSEALSEAQCRGFSKAKVAVGLANRSEWDTLSAGRYALRRMGYGRTCMDGLFIGRTCRTIISMIPLLPL